MTAVLRKPGEGLAEGGPEEDEPAEGGLAFLGDAPLARIAMASGAALPWMRALALRHGAAVDILAVDDRGRFSDSPLPWVPDARSALVAAGLDASRIRIVGSVADLAPCDLVLAPGLYGDRARIAGVAPILDRGLSPGGRIVLDLRKGAGGYPFLRARGTLVTLGTRETDGQPVARIVLTLPLRGGAAAGREVTGGSAADLTATDDPAFHGTVTEAPLTVGTVATPAVADPGDAPWADIARRLAGPDGYFREGAEHAFLFVPRGRTLVVTFDNLDIAMTKREDRRPWGFSFIEKQGWSMLGVTAAGWTWFRDPFVTEGFDRLRDEGFFARFDRVVFYGASMGGYAACAFSGACPGADVVAISPQSTLDRAVVPWETRYSTAWGRDFGGPTGDAAAASAAARRVVLLYDPYAPLDAAHVARFQGPNVMRLRAPLMGHRVGSSLQQMGILSAITVGALDGTLTEAAFYRALRARKTFPRYQRELFERAVAKGHVTLARRMARWVLVRGDNRAIRKRLAML